MTRVSDDNVNYLNVSCVEHGVLDCLICTPEITSTLTVTPCFNCAKLEADLQEARQQLREYTTDKRRDATYIAELEQQLAAAHEAHAATKARCEQEFDALNEAAKRDFARQAEQIAALTKERDAATP